MNIWKKSLSLNSINLMGKNTAVENLGIKITKKTSSSLIGEMPVDKRTCQVRGLLHGGSSAVFIETLGSIAGHLSTKKGFSVVGIEINANHVASINKGFVKGIAKAVHLGKTTQVWDVKIKDKDSKKTICVGRLTLAVIKIDT